MAIDVAKNTASPIFPDMKRILWSDTHTKIKRSLKQHMYVLL